MEGKATEPFGEVISSWVRNGTDDPTPTRRQRLSFLADRLGIDIDPGSDLRYQLLHRTYSVLAECRAFGARHGIVLIHSFSGANPDNWRDFRQFTAHLGIADIEKGVPRTWVCGEHRLLFVWVEDEPLLS